MKRNRLNGVLVASAAIGLLAAAPVAFADSHEGGDQVKCAGVNSCSGKGECAAADGSHDCGGKNSCSGKGWVKLSAADCEAQGGTVQE